jgi:hypothetical protein
MNLLIMQFSPIPLRSEYSPQHPVLKHLSLCSSLNARTDRVLEGNKENITGKRYS